MRLLFAEDDRSLCRAEKTILEKSGYSVDFVHNGQDALDYAFEGNYDGIILDWMMPAPDGVEVLRRLREKGPRSASTWTRSSPCPPIRRTSRR